MRSIVIASIVLAIGALIWLLGRDGSQESVTDPPSIGRSSPAAPPAGFHADAPSRADAPSPLVGPAHGATNGSRVAPVAARVPSAPVPTHSVAGRIVRASDGTPLGGVDVHFMDRDVDVAARSRESDGAFELLHVAQSGTTLALSGYGNHQQVAIPPGAADVGNLLFTFDSGFRIAGRVIDVRGAPLAGAKISRRDGGASCTSDASGRFVLRDVVAHGPSVALRAEAAWHEGVSVDVLAPDAVTLPAAAEIRLPDAGRLAGRVTGPDGQPVPGMFVDVLDPLADPGAPALARAQTDADGQYDTQQVPAGRFHVRVATQLAIYKAGHSILAPASALHGNDLLTANLDDVQVDVGVTTRLDVVVRPAP